MSDVIAVAGIHEILCYRLLTEPNLAAILEDRLDQIDFCAVCEKSDEDGNPCSGGGWAALEAILLYYRVHKALPSIDGLNEFVETDKRAAEISASPESIRCTCEALRDEPPDTQSSTDINVLLDQFVEDCGKKRTHAIAQSMMVISLNQPSHAKDAKGGQHDYGWERALIRGMDMIRTTQNRLNLAPAVMAIDAMAELQMPEDCGYGWLADFAKGMRCNFGFAYCSGLAAWAAMGGKTGVPFTDTVRSNLYVVLMGGVGCGKSWAMDCTTRCIQHDERLACYVDSTPASDRGLINLFSECPTPEPMLLHVDEFRDVLSKGSIEHSSLFNCFNKLFDHDRAGVADKRNHDTCQAKLSLLGGLTCENPSEFPTLFTAATAAGWYDRCILVPAPMWTGDRDDFVPDKVFRQPKSTAASAVMFDLVNKWRKKYNAPRRLAENALRVALITSSINQDSSVTEESIKAALRFAQWQWRVKDTFKPGMAKSEASEAQERILDDLRRAGGRGKWSDLGKLNNWYRSYRAGDLKMARKEMEEIGILGYDKDSGIVWLPND